MAVLIFLILIYIKLFMKKFLICLFIISIYFSNILSAKDEPFKEYKERHGIFGITYPSSWSCQEATDGLTGFYPSGEEAKNTGVAIIYGNLYGGAFISLDDLSAKFKKSFMESYPYSVEVEPSKKIDLSGSDAIFYHLKTNKRDNKNSRELFIVVSVNRDTIFIITAFSSEKNFHLYKDTYMAMIDKFITPVPIAYEIKTPVPAEDETFKLFTEEKFSIKYPLDWEVNNMSKADALSFGFSPPGEHPATHGFMVNILKLDSKKRDNMNLNLTAMGLAELYKRSLTDGQEVERGQDFTLNDMAARKFHIQGDLKGIKLDTVLIVAIGKEYMVIVTAARPVDDFSVYLPTFTDMIDTFQLLQTSSGKVADMKTFISPEAYFMMKYPSDWKMDNMKNPGKDTFTFNNSAVTSGAPLLIIDYMVMNEPGGVDVNIDGAAKKVIQDYKKDMKNFSELPKISTVTNKKGRMYHFKGDKNNINTEGILYLELKGNSLYALYLTVQSADFSDYKSMFMDIIDNFHVIIPEKKQGWSTLNEPSDLFFIQYPSQWTVEQKKSDRFSYLSVSPSAGTSWVNGINILYFKAAEKETIDTFSMDLLTQFEALGYSTPEKINGTFCNFPASIIKTRRTLRDNTNRDVYVTVTTFKRDDIIIQIYLSYTMETDQDIKDICNEILNTFRPFAVKSETVR